MNLDDLEKKYPQISEKEGWLDLHAKRGKMEINDQEFKIDLLKFGMENSDADAYIDFLVEVNEQIEDFTEDGKLMEMVDIAFEYEKYYDFEDEFKETLKNKGEKELKEKLQNKLNMKPKDVKIVVAHLSYMQKMDKDL